MVFHTPRNLCTKTVLALAVIGTIFVLSRESVENTIMRIVDERGYMKHFRNEMAADYESKNVANYTTLTAKNVRWWKHSDTVEHRHVVYLKVHKTGSSTIQNIFLRFGNSRNLTFMLAHDDKSKAEVKFPNVISNDNTLTEKNIVPPPPGKHYELLCCHVIYNRSQFEKYLPSDTIYIGSVREPIARLESALRYHRMFPDIPLSNFARAPLAYDRATHSMANNRMSFEFGFPFILFPNSPQKPTNRPELIAAQLQKLNEEFDLILVNELMDESLVLMKRLLGWHVKDIVYQKQLEAKQGIRRFSKDDRTYLKDYIALDTALYDFAKNELEKKIQQAGEDFREEVEQFKLIINTVTSLCVQRILNNTVVFSESKWDCAFKMTTNDCKIMRKSEIPFIQQIRLNMYGRLNN